MHDTIATITGHANTLLQVLAAFLVVLMTNGLTNRSRDRQDRATDRAALQVKVDTFITAAIAVRAAANVSDHIWEGPKEKWRATGIVMLGAFGGWASAEAHGRTDNWRYAAGLRDAAQLISREVHARKIALASLQASTVQLGAAATPLMRHQNERLVEAVEAVMSAASAIDDTARYERAMATFGQAARAALQPPPSFWARLVPWGSGSSR
ncbi:hypothetical protein OHU34_46000 (plasmid) [Streptomyces sp. NBC_00080]|uniref:hypothetical protein n=1 Tax=Streptomyces sp. NBC_00080 TaxID=2975645 RepID=UPI002F918A19